MKKNFLTILSMLIIFGSFCSSNIVLADNKNYNSMFATDNSEFFSVKLNNTNRDFFKNDFQNDKHIKTNIKKHFDTKKIIYKPNHKNKKKNILVKRHSETVREILRSGKVDPEKLLKYIKKKKIKVAADVAVELTELASERYINEKRINNAQTQLKCDSFENYNKK